MKLKRLKKGLAEAVMYCVFGVAFASGAGRVAVIDTRGNTAMDIGALETRQDERVAITTFLDFIGFTWRWDEMAEKLIAVRSPHKIVFSPDNEFCVADGELRRLETAPAREKGVLFLPITSLTALCAPYIDGRLLWRPALRRIEIAPVEPAIVGVALNNSDSGMTISIILSDSLDFHCEYHHPRFVVGIKAAAADTVKLRSHRKDGVVDSIFTRQSNDSAWIVIALNAPVKEHRVVRADRGRSVEVLLCPRDIPAAKKSSGAAAINQYKMKISTIVIDPGHGGKDPGAIGPSGVKEKDVVLAIARKVRDLVKEKSDLKVYLTREDDTYLTLRQRTVFANNKHADVFVSIHADAVPGSEKRRREVQGYKVYFLSQAKNEEDKMVAMRENAVIELEKGPKSGDDLHDIITEMVANEYLVESQDMSIMLAESFSRTLKKIRKLHLGVGQAPFWVLNGAYMPSVLVEVGFLSNPAEEKILAETKTQGDIARGIFDAIMLFREKYEVTP